MTEVSYPIVGGTGVTDAVYERLMAYISGNGRIGYNPTSSDIALPILYADSSGRQVKVRANQSVLLRGYLWESGTAGIVRSLTANTSGQTRLDMGVLRLDREDFTVRFEVIDGTASTTPVAPALTNQTGDTGYFEWPLGTIRVTSNVTAGLPSIAASDVTPMDTWLAPPNIVGRASRRDTVTPGGIYTEYDTGRVFAALGGSWHLVGENGDLTGITLAGGWSAPGNVYAKRRNGLTWFQGLAALSASNKAPNTSLVLCTLPDTFRPTQDLYVPALLGAANPAVVKVEADTGRVTLTDYSATFLTGQSIIISPVTWASKY